MSTSLHRFWPPAALMAVIFVLSDQPDLSTGLEGWDTVLRKAAHMTVFGSLWFLWWRAFGYARVAPSIAITLGYAAVDEWHQSFVPGRHGSAWDVAIDAAGVGVAGALVVAAARRGR